MLLWLFMLLLFIMLLFFFLLNSGSVLCVVLFQRVCCSHSVTAFTLVLSILLEGIERVVLGLATVFGVELSPPTPHHVQLRTL